MSDLLNILSARLVELPEIEKLQRSLACGGSITVAGLAGSLPKVLFAFFTREKSNNLIYIAHDSLHAEFARDDFAALLGEERVGYFCERSSIPSEYRLQNVTQANARIAALEMLLLGKPAVVVCTPKSYLERVAASNRMQHSSVLLRPNTHLGFSRFISHLGELGFIREDIVDRVGEFSVRGGIVDVYPLSRRKPVRIEFFGDEVESLREFDPQTQRSTASLQEVTLFPQHIEPDAGVPQEQDESDSPLSIPTIASYLNGGDFVVLEEPEMMARYLKNGETSDFSAIETTTLAAFLHAIDNCRGFAADITTVYVSANSNTDAKIIFHSDPVESMSGKFDILRETLDKIEVSAPLHSTHAPMCHFLCSSAPQKKRIEDLFDEENFEHEGLAIEECALNNGFLFWGAGIFILTDFEFFSRTRIPRSFLQPPQEGFTFRQLRALKRGDFVVHVDFGIGVYRGLKKISVGGSQQECVQIEYSGGDKVYVTLERLDRIKKYSAREGGAPHINRLGSVDWQKLKTRVKKRLKDISEKLIALYAMRHTAPGFAFAEDDIWQHELEASFVYNETPDQLRATEEVKKDMESQQPMDRLICGDVGYGKTEVAVRAAFKAVNSGKQVAMLVPTTILANQHYVTFSERLASFPVTIAMLSRFRTKRQQQQVVSGLHSGGIDVVIGTHRLLSDDIAFKDLGLLIIDEEQRFGVGHKEKIKSLRAAVDVLTLTATPIPRTLHMALVGIRGMSRITTPPRNRLPIRTEVIQFNKEILRKALLREFHRGGQIFFVHNRVRSIDAMRAMLSRMCPEIKFAVAHGQMPERELERVMENFLQKKFDCLVSTMIIESGLDIPNVNTLIVNRADKFGLAQLYQLRGRVGRSSQQAFAYLIIPTIRNLTRDAIKRLQAIEELTELGSGYDLALRDLEVRGAGNLLGAEQSGFMDALGSDLFYKILEEAINEVKKEAGHPMDVASAAPAIETQVHFQESAFIPDSYVSMSTERVDIYRRLIDAKTVREIEHITDELRDRFGDPPEETKNLLDYIGIKILGNLNQVSEVKINMNELDITFDATLLTDTSRLQEKLASIVHKGTLLVTFDQENGLRMRAALVSHDRTLSVVKKFLQSIV